MVELGNIYRCNICGNIIEIMHAGAEALVCCGQPMEKLEAKTEDTGAEKHVPVITKTDNGFIVKVGDVPHPMEEAHYIEWIELIADGISYHKFLKPGEKPETEFCVKADSVSARAYCNVHSLWGSK